MNKRIKELVKQAGLEMCSCGCDMPTRQSAKFAELIVRECLTLTLGKDRRQLLDKGDLNGANLVQKDIIRVIEHFGVES